MPSYKVEVTYSDGYVEDIEVSEENDWKWLNLPRESTAMQKAEMITCANNAIAWLRRNGGSKIEVTETT